MVTGLNHNNYTLRAESGLERICNLSGEVFLKLRTQCKNLNQLWQAT